MDLHNYGIRKRDLREGPGRGSGNDHFEDLLGSTEFYIYQAPDQTPKGYEGFKLFIESQGCKIIFTIDTPVDVGDEFQALRVTCKGKEIPAQVLKRSHTWAHQRNLLHSFYKPLYH